MSSSFPFSLVLPEGGRSAVRKPSIMGALVDARTANVSRAGRDIPLVLLLNRDTGGIFEVPPDADLLSLEGVLREDIRKGPVAPVDLNDPAHFAYDVYRSVQYSDLSVFGYTLILRHGNETMVVFAPPGEDATVRIGGKDRPWETFTTNETDKLSQAWGS